jgi:hypothetical protein
MASFFLCGLLDAGIARELPTNTTLTIFKDVISDLADQLSLQSLESREATNKKIVPSRYGYPSRPAPPSAPVIEQETRQSLTVLLCHCLSVGVQSQLDQITTRLVQEAQTAPTDLFDAFYLPLLKELIVQIRDRQLSVQGTKVREMFQLVLGTYIQRWVGEEPTPTKNWVRSTVNCSCTHCSELNTFVRSATEVRHEFAIGVREKKHLHAFIMGKGKHQETVQNQGSLKKGPPMIVTNNQARYNADHKAWKQRCNTAKNYLQGLGTEALKEYLLALYRPIMSTSAEQVTQAIKDWRRWTTALDGLKANDNASNRVLPPILRRKVPSEVIILDD